MRFQILGLVAALALTSACAAQGENGAASSGSGDATAPVTQTTATTGSTSSGVGPEITPVGPSPGSETDFIVNVGNSVYFDFDKYSLKTESRQTLEKQAAWLKKYPSLRVTIEGHCDERGTTEYNLALGDRRANAIKDYLVALGINPGRIKTISYGKEKPVAMGSNEAAWTQNRRGMTVIGGAGA